MLLILCISRFGCGKELNCRMEKHGFGLNCKIYGNGMVAIGSENIGYTFKGWESYKNTDVKSIEFKDWIPFIPKEAFLTFPNIDGVDLSSNGITNLTYHYMSNLFKFAPRPVSKISFFKNNIKEIEPRAILFLENRQFVDFNENICISESFEKTKNMTNLKSILELSLQSCFNNFFSSKFNSMEKEISEKISILSNNNSVYKIFLITSLILLILIGIFSGLIFCILSRIFSILNRKQMGRKGF